MFRKDNLGMFGERVDCDVDGYIPEVDDGPWDFRIDHGSESTHDEQGRLTPYGIWWKYTGFPEWKKSCIKQTKAAILTLEKNR